MRAVWPFFSRPLAEPCPAEQGATNTRGTFGGQATLPLFVLHRAGFTMPPLLPSGRWALTPPFHPYPRGRFVFCGTFRPLALSRESLAFTRRAALRCPDFPLRACARSGHPNPGSSARSIAHPRPLGKRQLLLGARCAQANTASPSFTPLRPKPSSTAATTSRSATWNACNSGGGNPASAALSPALLQSLLPV